MKRTEALSVFGAACVSLPDQTIICGGTRHDGAVLGQAITSIQVTNDEYKATEWQLNNASQIEIPFMVGASIVPREEDLLVLGGGATCFSMGTFWETGLYSVKLPEHLTVREGSAKLDNSVTFLESHRVVGAPGDAKSQDGSQPHQKNDVPITTIPRVKADSSADFENHLKNGKPVIVEGLNLGGCVEKWSPEYMVDAVGADKEVTPSTETNDMNSK